MHVIGLGNHGEEYKNTRHNVAWTLLDVISGDWTGDKYMNADISTVQVSGKEFIFVKPQTFMNSSGQVIPYLLKNFGATNDTMLVVQDDIDLPLGTLRLSYDRGDGGHNGIKSIVTVLGSKQFLRLRVGISIVGEDGKLHKPNVLGAFSKVEMKKLEEVKLKFKDLLNVLAKEGKEKAMTEFNK